MAFRIASAEHLSQFEKIIYLIAIPCQKNHLKTCISKINGMALKMQSFLYILSNP